MSKVVKTFWRFAYWLKAIIIGLRASPTTVLGSLVIYEGKTWHVYNGATADMWNLLRDGEYILARRCDCRRVHRPKEWVHAYRMMYMWWMISWHRIYVERRNCP